MVNLPSPGAMAGDVQGVTGAQRIATRTRGGIPSRQRDRWRVLSSGADRSDIKLFGWASQSFLING
jgi:hypothetical protein